MRATSRALPLFAGLLFLSADPVSAQRFIAYEVPEGAVGNQDFGGALGMDFDVDLDIEVTRLGVFDDGSDGLNLPISARLYDRDTLEELVNLEFTPADPGELVGGSRFKDLAEPLELSAGFRGTMVAEGYGVGELLANSGFGPAPIAKTWTTNDGNCSLLFVGTARYGVTPGFFPDTQDQGPADRYAAGTFEFEPLEEVVPRAGIAFVVPEFTVGNQSFNGALGMDFDTRTDILVTRLGVFDDGSDGLTLNLTARLYDRNSQAELASLEFTVDDPGELVGGSRFKDLDPPLGLPLGFQGTIVAEGYGAGEQYGNNAPATPLNLSTDNGGCAIGLGDGRFGLTPGLFPDTADVGAVPRYAAGTFAFGPSDTPIQVPGAPRNLTALGEDARVRLSWSPPAAGPAVAGYNVHQTSPGATRKVNPALITATQFTAADLASGVEACFVVRGVLASGLEGESSNEACAAPTIDELPEELFIAYEVPPGTVGNQVFDGALGMDFDVKRDIAVTRLGVFDDGSDGLTRTITARLYDRETLAELASIDFTTNDPGELVGGSRLKDLPNVISLGAGFRGTIVAEGYGDTEQNGNHGQADLGLTTNDAQCSIWFAGSRFGPAGSFPATFDTAPVPNAFAAGTFEFGPLDAGASPPQGGIAYEVAAGTQGTQDFGGTLGMDFDVHADILITRLGVFDDGSDGLNLPISARLYNRDTQIVLASVEFTPEDPGEQIGGSWFKDLEEPVGLPPGFHATIVGEGYGALERNVNQGAGLVPGLTTNDGGCLITFVGGGRWGTTPGGFPDVLDTGPANRFGAGTFAFEPSDTPVVLPPEPPQGLMAASGDRQITLSWQPSQGTTPAARYKVFRSAGRDPFTEVAEVQATRHTDTGLTNGTDVCYRVRAVAADGQESADSRVVCGTPGAVVGGRVVAYEVPSGTLGTTVSDEAFGMDFDVELDIRVTRLGAFDDGSDGLARSITVTLYNRDTQMAEAVLDFSADDPGALINGSRFKDLEPALDLPAGFRGSIVAEGYGDGERVGIGGGGVWSINPGPCSLAFQRSRRDFPGLYPLAETPGSNPYAAGTFEFEPQELLPPGQGGIAYVVPPDTVGNQPFGGPLGMDFDVRSDIEITRLGVFDDGSDGLTVPLTARLYDRDTEGELAFLEFTPEDPGELVDGSRLKALATPIPLRAGFHGTIVAEGYGITEQNGNQGDVDLGLLTDSAGCSIAFVGGGRYGQPADVGIFPATVDQGPANRYAAGTFEYVAGEIPPDAFVRGDVNSDGNLNITDPINVLGFLFLGDAIPTVGNRCLDAADFDDDGNVNITDAIQSLNFQFQGGPGPVPPVDACGPDPNADELECTLFPACE